MGINFGTGIHNFGEIAFYTDANCTAAASKNDFGGQGVHWTLVQHGSGLGCIHPGQPAAIGSVRIVG